MMCDLSTGFILLSKRELVAPSWRSVTKLTFEAILKSVFQTKNFFVCVCETVGWISAWLFHSALLSTTSSGK